MLHRIVGVRDIYLYSLSYYQNCYCVVDDIPEMLLINAFDIFDFFVFVVFLVPSF